MPDDARQEPRRGGLRHDAEPAEDEADAGLVEASRTSMGSVIVAPMPTAGAVDGADHGLGAAVDRQRHPAAGVAHARRRSPGRRGARAGPRASGARRLVEAEHVAVGGEVHAGAERPAAAGDHDGARRRRRRWPGRRRRSSSSAIVTVNALSWSGRSRVSVRMPSSSTVQRRASRRPLTGCTRPLCACTGSWRRRRCGPP